MQAWNGLIGRVVPAVLCRIRCGGRPVPAAATPDDRVTSPNMRVRGMRRSAQFTHGAGNDAGGSFGNLALPGVRHGDAPIGRQLLDFALADADGSRNG